MYKTARLSALNAGMAGLLFLISLILPFKCLGFSSALYQYDIHYLKLDKQLQISAQDLLINYKEITNYLTDEFKSELTLPAFSMSDQGRVHFEDVKRLFLISDRILSLSVCFMLIGLLVMIWSGSKLSFLKWTAYGLLILPVVLAIPFLTSFEKVFIGFHQVLFSNDYWIFDPITDPIIQALPEAYFFHCGMVILGMILCLAVLYYGIYAFIEKRNICRSKEEI